MTAIAIGVTNADDLRALEARFTQVIPCQFQTLEQARAELQAGAQLVCPPQLKHAVGPHFVVQDGQVRPA